MKIVKKFSKISSQRGWIFFTLGLLVAFFISGALKSPVPIHKIQTKIAKSVDPFGNIDFVKNGELNLSNGFWPRIGFYFSQIELSPHDSCAPFKSYILKEVFIPISMISSLLNGRWSIGIVDINSIDFQESLCIPSNKKPLKKADSLNENVEGATVSDSEKEGDLIYEHLKRKKNHFVTDQQLVDFYNSVEKIGVVIDGFKVNRMNFEPNIPLNVVENFKVLFRSEKEYLKVKSSFDVLLFSESERVNLSSDMKIKPLDLHIDIKTQWREAKAKLSFYIHPDKYSSHWSWKQFPVKRLLNLVSHESESQGKLLQLWKPQFLWSSCDSFAEFKKDLKLALNFKDCEFFGDMGRIKLNGEIVGDGQKSHPEKLSLFFEKISLQNLISSFNRTGPTGILHKFGELGGELNIKKWDDLEFKWALQDLELRFSNGLSRDLQRLTKLSGRMSYRENRISGIMDQMTLEDGSFKGKMSFNLDPNFSNGLLQVSVDEIIFSPKIQGLLLDGEMSALQIYGLSHIQSGEIKDWKGSFGLESIDSPGASLKKLKLVGELKEEQLNGDLSIENVNFKNNNTLRQQFFKFLGEETPKELSLSQLKSKLMLEKTKGAWRKLEAKTLDKKKIMSSGSWESNSLDIKGQVTLGSKKLQFFTNSQKELVLKNRKKVKNIGSLGEALKSSRLGVFKRFSKKVLNSAQKMIPKPESQNNNSK